LALADITAYMVSYTKHTLV